jgi:acyl carrier protein
MTPSENRQTLTNLLADVFLLDEDSLADDLTRAEIDTWDSLGTVSLALGVDETFGYHMKPEEAIGLESISDLVALLRERGIEIE